MLDDGSSRQSGPRTGPRDVIIEAIGVHKVYQAGTLSVPALRGVSLSIERGAMVAVMGPSGCGKTTLLNTLSGLDDLTAGEVLIEGTALHSLSDRQRTRYRAERMGFVFQLFNLLPVLTAAENVELPLLVAGVKPHVARRSAEEALELVGLAGEGTKRPAEMSGGQQQRVSVARALVNEPAIVWADEPTGSLDSETSAEVMALLSRLNREKGQTFVLVTHDPTVAAAADRIVRMRSGLIDDDGLGGDRFPGAAAEPVDGGRLATGPPSPDGPTEAAVDAEERP